MPGLQASFTVSIGVRKPTLYRIELHTCSYWSLVKKALNEKYVKETLALFLALLSYMGLLATLLCRESKVTGARNIYSDSLSAAVVLMDPGLQYSTKCAKSM